jgi:hypothetical protein
MKNSFWLLICMINFTSYCQEKDLKNQAGDKRYLDSLVNKLVSNKYYVDEKVSLKIVFTLKVDSLGEIHSAHVRWSRNFKADSTYEICREIEEKIMAKFLYDEFKDKQVKQKYVSCDYPFFSRGAK